MCLVITCTFISLPALEVVWGAGVFNINEFGLWRYSIFYARPPEDYIALLVIAGIQPVNGIRVAGTDSHGHTAIRISYRSEFI